MVTYYFLLACLFVGRAASAVYHEDYIGAILEIFAGAIVIGGTATIEYLVQSKDNE